jgi:hypothetical protein
MAKCEVCGTRILFGAVKAGEHRYCSDKCAKDAVWQGALKLVPEEELEREVRAVHQGNCPKCQGPGPVDVHTSHKVASAIVFTRWSSHPIIACRSCGKKQQLKHALYSFFLGWWGFPFGLIATPVQVIKNFGGLLGLSGPNPENPSPALARAVRLSLASRKRAAAAGPGIKPTGKMA